MPAIPQNMRQYNWSKLETIEPANFSCGFCGHRVASEKGWMLFGHGGTQLGGVFICPECKCPTFIYPGGTGQNPAVAFGLPVPSVPSDLTTLYEEARTCTASGCYTAAVLLLRKMLMNIAVEKGAAAGLPFVKYVDYLETNHFTPPDSRDWVDHIRKKGNEATHEIALMGQHDAKELIDFVEMLLRFNFEFPSRFKTAPASNT